MSERSQNELNSFEQGILLTLSTLVGELREKGLVDSEKLNRIHRILLESPSAEASVGPLEKSRWEWGISPLLANVEINGQ
ncbi:hypothetical protein [Stenotrophomonas maltophilia]|uniref:hypothetical protein n=1 Tax=Stenotrophomonas maltophilia TaxID=40324 RepID=UPI0013DC9F32|nr:hypothetical protein [Stenotrophomonas maltophilia]